MFALPALMTRFRPTLVEQLPVVRTDKESTRRPRALVLQLGPPTVEYDDPTIVSDMGVHDAAEKISAAIYPMSVGRDVFN